MMKKHVVKFLLGIMYIVSVVALLMTHIWHIAGRVERMMAMVETLLLVIPMIVILYLYVRITEADKKKSDKKKSDKRNINKKELDKQNNEEGTAPKNSGKLISTYEEFEETVVQYGLSKRELEVAWLLYKGYTNRQVAETLFVAENTIKKHTSHIYEKMHVSGRKEMKAMIMEMGN